VYLGAGDRHLAPLAVEHMINGPIAVTNTHTHNSANDTTLSRLMDEAAGAAAVPRATGFDGRSAPNMFLAGYEIELDKETIS
jgi:hypothetical protein